MALRGGNQAVAPHSPFLKAADTNLVGFPSRPGIRAGKRPVVLGLIAPKQKVIHHNRKIWKCGHERLCQLGNAVPADSRRIIVDTQRPVLREERSHTCGILATPCRSVAGCEIPQFKQVRQHTTRSLPQPREYSRRRSGENSQTASEGRRWEGSSACKNAPSPPVKQSSSSPSP